MKKIVLGISGSSGAIYAHRLMQKLSAHRGEWDAVGVVASVNANVNWNLELGSDIIVPEGMHRYEGNDFNAPFASGSAQYDTMILCPCSVGTLARIATGISNDLMTRAADVILKERRKLILVPRETPLSLIHLKNMIALTESGAVILPAIPSFYSNPTTVEELIDTVVDRILDHAGIVINSKRWGK